MNDKLQNLLDEKNYVQIKSVLNDMHPQDIALLLEDLSEISEKDIVILFRLLNKENAAETFVEMSSTNQEYLINAFSDAELKSVLDEMFLDDTVDIIEEMPASVVKRIINQSDSDTRALINQILKYPKDSAGTLMTVEYVSLKKNWTVRECFARIRKVAVDKETIYTCYVTDEKRKLIGIVSVKTLLLHSDDTVIEDIMETDVIAVDTNADKEFVVSQFSKYDLTAMPVVDMEHRIVGIVTVDDALDVMEDEASEDIAKMGAVTPSDTPYLEQSVFHIWKNRILWLVILLVSSTFTGLIINSYEAMLDGLLFACVPMIMGTGGNAGSQASVTITRGLALKEIETRDVLRVMWKELRVSALLATTLAIACFGKLMLIDNLIFHYDYTYNLCLIISLALFLTIVLAKIVGCLMPILAKLCKLDPAVVASPFITTIVDVLSLILYCGIATALLPAV
ncbi:MAG: magnesium transporter [Corallococcus sp.]|nr:magnesium transporter [Corallococcus sp.]